jgi:predicted HAD superfamily Cof-like phosphohydrolase
MDSERYDPAVTPVAEAGRTAPAASGDASAIAYQLVLPLEEQDLPTPLLRQPRLHPPSPIAAMVAAFHKAFRLPRRKMPSLDGIDRPLIELRTRLLDEEAAEFAAAAAQRDLVGMADALADVVYVAYGTALTVGVNLDAVLDEVHRSNMSKLDAEGRPLLRYDGKVLKSPGYSPRT